MEVTLLATYKRVKQNIQRDHYWYDHSTQQMLHGVGGEMRFRYDAKTKKTIPYLVDQAIWVNKLNYPDIKDWIFKNKHKFGIEVIADAPNKSITIQVDASQFDEMQTDLYRQGITVDWDETELKKELN